MNYTQQLAALGGVVTAGVGVMSAWKSAIYYGKSHFSDFGRFE